MIQAATPASGSGSAAGRRHFLGNGEPPARSARWASQHSPGANMSNTKQDRARVSGGQDHEVQYEANKTGASKSAVKDAVKSAGNSRSAVEKKLGSK
jgi:hypothetical protein